MNGVMRRGGAVLISAACVVEGAGGRSPQNASVINANHAFACALYGQLRVAPGNLFLSPYSISSALAMTYAGARGQTEKQMAHVLHLSGDPTAVHAVLADVQKRLNAIQDRGQVQLRVANSLWAQKTLPFQPAFLDLLRKNYEAGVNLVNFAADPEPARLEINRWVEGKTAGRIKDLVKPGMLHTDTRLILCNAIYFRGDWASQFRKEQTREEPFTLASGHTAPVALMRQTATFGYAEQEGLQILELPYAGEDVSMIVLLPAPNRALPQMESDISPQTLKAWMTALHRREVQVFLPKFTLTSEFDLGSTLASLGMTDAFTASRADFSGMTGTRDLFLSKVLHKAFVDVNEQGTEAAAATGAVMTLTAIPEPPPVFRADRPFVFLIREKRSGIVLFMGRFADPRK